MKANDVMRRKPRGLDEEEAALMDTVKAMGEELYALIDGIGETREIALAKTKLEECVMWTVKHITR